MDYKTKPTSRKDLRKYAEIIRKLFQVSPSGAFPVLYALEKLPDVFPGSNFIVLEDNQLPPNTMARCSRNESCGFTIEIKKSVYDGAYEKQVGAFL